MTSGWDLCGRWMEPCAVAGWSRVLAGWRLYDPWMGLVWPLDGCDGHGGSPGEDRASLMTLACLCCLCREEQRDWDLFCVLTSGTLSWVH